MKGNISANFSGRVHSCRAMRGQGRLSIYARTTAVTYAHRLVGRPAT